MTERKFTSQTRYARTPTKYNVTKTLTVNADGTKTPNYKVQELRGQPRACLVTMSDGATVYFGISRCHETDNFSKPLGRRMAYGRAGTASAELHSFRGADTALSFDCGRLVGVVGVNNLDDLFDLFYNIEKRIYAYYAADRQARYEESLQQARKSAKEPPVFGLHAPSTAEQADGASET